MTEEKLPSRVVKQPRCRTPGLCVRAGPRLGGDGSIPILWIHPTRDRGGLRAGSDGLSGPFSEPAVVVAHPKSWGSQLILGAITSA